MVVQRALIMLAVGVGAAAAIVACASFTPSGETPDASTDGGAQEGSLDAVAADGPADAAADRVNLLRNGDFEQKCSAVWDNNSAALSDDTTAPHSGKTACLVCGTGGTSAWSITQTVVIDAVAAGRSYRAEAWVQEPAVNGAKPVSCEFDVQDGLGNSVQSFRGPQSDPTPKWRLYGATLTLEDAGAGGTLISMNITARQVGGCFLVDDAALYLLP